MLIYFGRDTEHWGGRGGGGAERWGEDPKQAPLPAQSPMPGIDSPRTPKSGPEPRSRVHAHGPCPPRQPVRSFPARPGNFTLGHPSAKRPRFRKSPANWGTPRTPRASPATPLPPRALTPPCPPAPAVLPAPQDWRPSAHTCPPPRARPLLTACPTHPSPHTARVPRRAACSRLASLFSPPPPRQPSGRLPPLVASSPRSPASSRPHAQPPTPASSR